jgi:hypothetical protein
MDVENGLSRMDLQTALWFLYSQTSPDVRRELPEQVIAICNRNWKTVEFASTRLRELNDKL